ncbi:hypothetical protein P3X46_028786 [Hevea brasiliensis]|uniref:RWP-RK domain-containing protein n=1 Tax=Hevea brasiliensis TaxID=3981 RepID=A0ABQ9KQ57_HEVBR|nr:protein RKD4-like [Hevea brasiliensis]KAJ9146536.1 hypothetical protein P3X46_028786 [Hevea brasiliensis]
MDSKRNEQLMNIPKKENTHDTDCFFMDESFEKLSELPSLESILEFDSISLPYDTNFGFDGFQDLNINDYFLGNNSWDEDVVVDAKPTIDNIVKCDDDFGATSSKEKEKRVVSGRKRSAPLELVEIRKHFDVPITKAAKKMKVGLTVLKKRCRELGITRWPHRKIRSLKSLISNVKEMGLTNEIVMLEEHQRLLEKKPDMELNDSTKRLRQSIFKANYKKRCLAAHHA